jgi:hypothetical protein
MILRNIVGFKCICLYNIKMGGVNLKNDKVALAIVFLSLSALNYFQVTEISEKAVFGFTVGALFMSISAGFDGEIIILKKNIQVNISSIFKSFFYYSSWLIIFGFLVIKETDFIKQLVTGIDSNTLMLVSLGITMLSIRTSEINARRIEQRQKEAEQQGAIDILNKFEDVLKKKQ